MFSSLILLPTEPELTQPSGKQQRVGAGDLCQLPHGGQGSCGKKVGAVIIVFYGKFCGLLLVLKAIVILMIIKIA